jgi:integrase
MTQAEKRRANGDAKVSQGRDGRWFVFVELPPGPNGRRRKLISGKSRGVVVKKRNEVLAELAKGGTGGHQRDTVAQVVENYLTHREGAIADSTLSNYRIIAARHIIGTKDHPTTIGKKAVAKLTVDDVDALILEKQKTLSPRTVKLIRTILGAALNRAEQRKIPGVTNVVRWTEGPKMGQTTHRAMTEDQRRAVQEAAIGTRFEAAFALMLSIGLRPGEVLGLSWADVELDESDDENETRMLTVRHGLKRDRTLGDVKNDGSRRQIPIPAKVLPMLRARQEVQEFDRQFSGEYWQGNADDLVFTTKVGMPVSDRNLATRDFASICEAAGVGRWHLHECRHTAATLALINGVPIEFVANMLGHRDIRQTANTYAHVRPRHLETAVQTINDAIWGA